MVEANKKSGKKGGGKGAECVGMAEFQRLRVAIKLQLDQLGPIAFESLPVRGFHDGLPAMNAVVHGVDHPGEAPFTAINLLVHHDDEVAVFEVLLCRRPLLAFVKGDHVFAPPLQPEGVDAGLDAFP